MTQPATAAVPNGPAARRVLESIDVVDAGTWNDAVDRLGGSLFHRHEWLCAVAAGGLVDADEHHVVLCAGDTISALAPCLVTRRCPKLEMFRDYYLRSPFAGEPIAVVHSMYAQTSQLLGTGPADRELLLDALEQECVDQLGIGLLLPMVAADDPLLDLLRARGWPIGLLSCTNLLPVPWSRFDEYLSDLSSAKRRNVRSSLLAADEQGLTVRIRRDRGGLDTLARLVAGTARRHGSPLFFDRRFLRAVMTAFGDRALTVEVTAEPGVLLSCLCLQHDGVLVPWAVGLEYDALDRYDHYNVLYAALVRLAVEEGISEINFGRSTYVIKRKFGCTQRPVYAAMSGPAARRAEIAAWISAIDRRARNELAAVNLVVADDGRRVVRRPAGSG